MGILLSTCPWGVSIFPSLFDTVHGHICSCTCRDFQMNTSLDFLTLLLLLFVPEKGKNAFKVDAHPRPHAPQVLSLRPAGKSPAWLGALMPSKHQHFCLSFCCQEMRKHSLLAAGIHTQLAEMNSTGVHGSASRDAQLPGAPGSARSWCQEPELGLCCLHPHLHHAILPLDGFVQPLVWGDLWVIRAGCRKCPRGQSIVP